jgi:putative tryptophan/tyrosine transport system substrate-binding protein
MQLAQLKRREFIALVGGATATWPLAAHAQPTTPVIGWLSSTTAEGFADRLNIFRERLKEAGFTEGQNLAIEYRWASDHNDLLPTLAADLVGRHVNVIVCGGGTPVALAAKAATTTIPIVFAISADPVRAGIVSNLNRPDGNITGVVSFTDQLITKRFELLAELLPNVTTIGALLNPSNSNFQNRANDLQVAAKAIGRELRIVLASNATEIEKAFSSALEQRIGALVIQNEAEFISHREEVVTLAARNKLPTIYETREDVVAGGLVSYGASTTERYRQLADYTASILKGEKPQNLPIERPTQFNLIINLKTAKALGLTIPGTVIARADELIE